ncbi:MAG: hypothetical protein ABJP66_06585 [Hyphomicrobiales bacterium]|uniref:hypothetical protein n=1 Tax=Shimia thalassica TaxID=1715693 RepID=UPI003296EFF9
MENPLKNIEFKVWPDYLLAVSALLLVISVGALFAGAPLGLPLSALFGGFFLFAIGGKIAHYKFRAPEAKGNANVWVSGWRHSFVADCFALLGVGLIVWAIWALS